jgi:hypothetical protein
MEFYSDQLPPELEGKLKRRPGMSGYWEKIEQRAKEKGIEEGVEKATVQHALDLLKNGVPQELIIKSLHVSNEWLQKLLKKMQSQESPS